MSIDDNKPCKKLSNAISNYVDGVAVRTDNIASYNESTSNWNWCRKCGSHKDCSGFADGNGTLMGGIHTEEAGREKNVRTVTLAHTPGTHAVFATVLTHILLERMIDADCDTPNEPHSDPIL